MSSDKSDLIISIDWLQLHCSAASFALHSKYEFKLQSFQTRQFRQVFEVYYRNEEFAQICCKPVSSVIDSNCIIIKFKNRQLYGTDVIYVADLFCKEIEVQVIGITRLDLCVDIQKFAYNLLPSSLIAGFLSSKYLKVGQGKYTLIGHQAKNHVHEYLRFGSKTSDVNAYMYNKSKELKDVQDKPYIREKWRLQGLDVTKDIWRLEVSIKGSGTNYLDLTTSELTKIDYLKLNNSVYLSNLFKSYIYQYFRFKINSDLKNKSRLPDLVLFHNCDMIYKPFYLPHAHGSNRSDKIFVKKLFMLDQELRGANNYNLNNVDEVLTMFVRENSLQKYVADKAEFWKRESFKSS